MINDVSFSTLIIFFWLLGIKKPFFNDKYYFKIALVKYKEPLVLVKLRCRFSLYQILDLYLGILHLDFRSYFVHGFCPGYKLYVTRIEL